MQRRASSLYGAGNAAVGQMSWHAVQEPQWSVSAASARQVGGGKYRAEKQP